MAAMELTLTLTLTLTLYRFALMTLTRRSRTNVGKKTHSRMSFPTPVEHREGSLRD